MKNVKRRFAFFLYLLLIIFFRILRDILLVASELIFVVLVWSIIT